MPGLRRPAGLPISEKGAAFGVATLDANGRVVQELATPGAANRVRYAPGYYLRPYMASLTTRAMAAGALHASPIEAPRGASIDRIAVNITVAQPDSTLRFGLYDLAENGRPGALIAELGTVAGDTTGVRELTGLDVEVPELFYAAVVSQGNASDVTVTAFSGMFPPVLVQNVTFATTMLLAGLVSSPGQVTGALPATWGGLTMNNSSSSPVIVVRMK